MEFGLVRRKITNVAVGTRPADAVNVGQLSGRRQYELLAARLAAGPFTTARQGTISAPSATPFKARRITPMWARHLATRTPLSAACWRVMPGPLYRICASPWRNGGLWRDASVNFGAIAAGPEFRCCSSQANDNGVAGSAVLGQGAFC